jgi:hypothetical protein
VRIEQVTARAATRLVFAQFCGLIFKSQCIPFETPPFPRRPVTDRQLPRYPKREIRADVRHKTKTTRATKATKRQTLSEMLAIGSSMCSELDSALLPEAGCLSRIDFQQRQ